MDLLFPSRRLRCRRQYKKNIMHKKASSLQDITLNHMLCERDLIPVGQMTTKEAGRNSSRRHHRSTHSFVRSFLVSLLLLLRGRGALNSTHSANLYKRSTCCCSSNYRKYAIKRLSTSVPIVLLLLCRHKRPSSRSLIVAFDADNFFRASFKSFTPYKSILNLKFKSFKTLKTAQSSRCIRTYYDISRQAIFGEWRTGDRPQMMICSVLHSCLRKADVDTKARP
jgi:hypothetical protein